MSEDEIGNKHTNKSITKIIIKKRITGTLDQGDVPTNI